LAEVVVPREIREVVDQCVARFSANLRAALWHGSGARGEAGPASDYDLILIFQDIDETVLLQLRDIFKERENWSTYIRSAEELRQLPADQRLQLAYGFRVLHGRFEPLRPTRREVLAELRSLADEITFQCRYRLIHKDADWPRQVHMMHYMAKSAVLAMKARHLLWHGHYPETRADLRPLVDDAEEREIIDWVEHWQALRPTFEADPAPLMLQLDAFARRLLESLSKERGAGGIEQEEG
jgi:predicted nucleotidyltransferase